MAWLLLERELQCRVSPLQETLALSSGTVASQACASAETPTSGGSAPGSGSTRDSTGVSEAFLRPLDTLPPEGFIESGLPRERSATQPLQVCTVKRFRKQAIAVESSAGPPLPVQAPSQVPSEAS